MTRDQKTPEPRQTSPQHTPSQHTPAPFRYQIAIQASAKAVWAALIEPEFTQQYWHSTRVRSDWHVGSRVEFLVPDGTVGCEGKVLVADPVCRLSYTWRFPRLATSPDAPFSRVTFTLAEQGGMTLLTIIHDEFSEADLETYEMVTGGWPLVLAGLKTLLETGATPDFSALLAAG